MRFGVIGGLGAVALATLTLPASAQDTTGYRAIAAGNLSGAERALVAERRIYPKRPELMLNLAAVYARTGRDAQARALYDSALSTSPVDLDMPNGAVVSSHAVAQTGLSKLSGALVATR